jgi:hypothetical protein
LNPAHGLNMPPHSGQEVFLRASLACVRHAA